MRLSSSSSKETVQGGRCSIVFLVLRCHPTTTHGIYDNLPEYESDFIWVSLFQEGIVDVTRLPTIGFMEVIPWDVEDLAYSSPHPGRDKDLKVGQGEDDIQSVVHILHDSRGDDFSYQALIGSSRKLGVHFSQSIRIYKDPDSWLYQWRKLGHLFKKQVNIRIAFELRRKAQWHVGMFFGKPNRQFPLAAVQKRGKGPDNKRILRMKKQCQVEGQHPKPDWMVRKVQWCGNNSAINKDIITHHKLHSQGRQVESSLSVKNSSFCKSW